MIRKTTVLDETFIHLFRNQPFLPFRRRDSLGVLVAVCACTISPLARNVKRASRPEASAHRRVKRFPGHLIAQIAQRPSPNVAQTRKPFDPLADLFPLDALGETLALQVRQSSWKITSAFA